MKRRDVWFFCGLFAAFFALYALTAQRGLGWGDSGEFQHRILHCSGLLTGCSSYATAHPLYVLLGKGVCRTPFQVTLLSSFFGALSAAGLFLCTRKVMLAVVFGLSHMLWWLSCVAEVQTLNLAFTVFETLLFLRFLESRRTVWAVAALFLSGLHLEVHNFALLALPVYGVVLLRSGLGVAIPSGFAWAVGASGWLHCLVTRGPIDVLVGGYGAKVAGVLPGDFRVTGFNLVLAALSFFAPVALAWWNRDRLRGLTKNRVVLALLTVNLVFWIRYFVPDQATFLLPTLFYAFLLIAPLELSRNRAVPLAIQQVLLPLLVWQALSLLPVPRNRTPHPHRNEASYFALPWKFNDDSADRCAADVGGEWTGYPTFGKEGGR